MKIITISREFGSGGRELGKRLSDEMKFDYYDREIIEAVSKNTGMKEEYILKTLENHGWRNIPLTFRHSFAGAASMQHTQTSFLLEQKRIIEGIAKLGKDCIIVGRNADVLLRDYHPLNLFVCADMQARINRCMERAPESENLSVRELERRIKNIDRVRARIRDILSDSRWGDPHNYHLTLNTTEWDIEKMVPAVVSCINCWFGGDR